MARIRVTFHRCIQDSQEYGSDDQHMISRIFFTIEEGGRRVGNLHADLKQIVGGDFERDPIEVSAPQGYSGPIDYEAFRHAAESYYRQLVGSTATGIHISPGAKGIRMYNNTFVREHVVEFDTPDA